MNNKAFFFVTLLFNTFNTSANLSTKLTPFVFARMQFLYFFIFTLSQGYNPRPML